MSIARKHIPRRAFLRGAAATLALPMLDAMTPALTAEALARDADNSIPSGAHIRTDIDVPVFDLQTEGDMVALRAHLTHQDGGARGP